MMPKTKNTVTKIKYKQALNCLAILAFITAQICPLFPQKAYAQSVSTQSGVGELNLPAPGTMVSLSPRFNPAIMKGITIHPQDPFLFDFIIHPGDDNLQGNELDQESIKLIKYFMAALTVPEEEMWVNLSPYEKNRIIPASFGETEMGRDLLAQDYLLKQLTATLMYPEEQLGNDFWKKVYQRAQEEYGTAEIPMNTFNKVWIVPDKAIIYENGTRVFVVESHLKVMLEKDYLALEENVGSTKHGLGDVQKDDLTQISEVSSEVIREIIIPEIEREVNEGKTFANLRQIANSTILATWYKQNLKKSILHQFYVDQNKTEGINNEDKEINQKIYNQYIAAFEKGVFNFIKEDYDPATQAFIPRKYFSGGVKNTYNLSKSEDEAQLGRDIEGSHSYRVRLDGEDNAMLPFPEWYQEGHTTQHPFGLGLDRLPFAEKSVRAFLEIVESIEKEHGWEPGTIVVFGGAARNLLSGNYELLEGDDIDILVRADGPETNDIIRALSDKFADHMIGNKLSDGILWNGISIDFLGYYNAGTGEIDLPYASRQQFLESVNCVWVNSKGTFYDYRDMIKDLFVDKRFRFVPYDSSSEDWEGKITLLDVLRAIRFKFELGLTFDETTEQLVKNYLKGKGSADYKIFWDWIDSMGRQSEHKAIVNIILKARSTKFAEEARDYLKENGFEEFIRSGGIDLDELVKQKQLNEFSFENSFGRRFAYRGITLVEVDSNDRIVDVFLPNDPRRDWLTEMDELRRELSDIREKEGLDPSQSVSRVPIGSRELGIRIDVDSLNPEKRRLYAGEKLFAQLVNYRNRSPELIRRVAQQRKIHRDDSLSLLSNAHEPQLVNIYVSDQQAGGTFGRAKIIADGLLSSHENVKVNIYVMDQWDDDMRPGGIDFGDSRDRLNIQLIKEEELVKQGYHRQTHFHVSTYGWPRGLELRESDLSFHAGPLGVLQNITVDTDIYRLDLVTSDLANPFGTVSMDPELLKRKIDKDSWSIERITEERNAWLDNNLTRKQRSSLQTLSDREQWNPLKSIWTSGYYKDTKKLLEEFELLRKRIREVDSTDFPFLGEGKQLLINLVRSTRTLKVKELTDKGFNVVMENGDIHLGRGDRRLPVTIVMHSNIKNTAFKTLYSELNGTLKRSQSGDMWIDFPVFVTGSISWLEAVSSGSIAVHDNYNADPNAMKTALMSTIMRHLALTYPDLSWDDLTEKASDYNKTMLMGQSTQGTGYVDLEQRTVDARKFAETLFNFNMVDDILYEISKRLPSEGGSAPRELAPSEDAMSADFSFKDQEGNKGGIDLNPNIYDIETRGTRSEIDFNFNNQSTINPNVRGLIPVIINVTPITNIPMLIGLEEDVASDLLSSAQ